MIKKQIVLVLLTVPLISFTALHKFYVSVTEIEHVKGQQSVQIISRVFIDDFENLLRQRYDEDITLATENENPLVDYYTQKYLNDKLRITINNKRQKFDFLGKEYEDDIMLCYMEIVDIDSISSIEISNKILFELFSDQKNIVRLKMNNINKSLLLIKENDKGMLNF